MIIELSRLLALQRTKKPCDAGAPLDEHGQLNFHDLRQNLLA
jgi:hypothetical protein